VVLTDVATGWTESVPILVREGALVVEALCRARELFPFALKGVDFDNDSAFMNDVVVPWCREQGLEVTRAGISQERSGLGRAEERRDRAPPGRLRPARRPARGRSAGPPVRGEPAAWQSSAAVVQLREKTRKGARVIKLYNAPEPPVARAIAHPALDPATKQRLQ
jgi:hypothetical protein